MWFCFILGGSVNLLLANWAEAQSMGLSSPQIPYI